MTLLKRCGGLLPFLLWIIAMICFALSICKMQRDIDERTAAGAMEHVANFSAETEDRPLRNLPTIPRVGGCYWETADLVPLPGRYDERTGERLEDGIVIERWPDGSPKKEIILTRPKKAVGEKIPAPKDPGVPIPPEQGEIPLDENGHPADLPKE